MQAICFKDTEIRYLGQKAFISYGKSIHLQSNKDVFNIENLPLEEYAVSLGLPGTPKLRFHKRLTIYQDSEAEASKPEELPNTKIIFGSDGEDEPKEADQPAQESSGEAGKSQKEPRNAATRTKVDRMFQKSNQTVLSQHYNRLVEHDDVPNRKHDQLVGDDSSAGEESEEEFISIKRADHDLEQDEAEEEQDEIVVKAAGMVDDPSLLTKRQQNKLKKKRLASIPKSQKVVFDAEGNAHAYYELEDEETFRKSNPDAAIRERLEREAAKMSVVDVEDKAIAKEKKHEKKAKKRRRQEMEDEVDE